MKRDFNRMMVGVERLHKNLMDMKPVTRDSLGSCRFPGVYLFTDDGKHLYVGRTRNLHRRLLEHSRPSVKDAPFAFRLARIATGNLTASYKADKDSRRELSKSAAFMAALLREKERIAEMSISYVRVDDDTTQALLEIYTSTVLGTPHNVFKTT